MPAAGGRNPVPESAGRLQVLFVADRDFFDRFGHMLRQVGLGLYGEGIHVALLTDDGEAAGDLEGTPIEVRGPAPLSGWRAWGLGRRLAGPPALVHLWGTACRPALADWGRPAGRPLLVHVTSQRDLERLGRRAPGANQHVAAACGHLHRALVQRWPLLAEGVHLVRPALLIPEPPPERRGDERTLGVLWTGRFEEQDGLRLIIEAVRQLQRRNCDVQVALIGSGRAERAIWQRVRGAGVAQRVSLIDAPELWESAVAGIDVYLVPARQEALGLAPLMAMALGKVVIASRDQMAEWFVEDQTAWQFTPGSAVELAYHLARAAERHPDTLKLSRSAAAYAREHHSITRLIAQLRDLYRRIAAGAGCGGKADNPDGAAGASR